MEKGGSQQKLELERGFEDPGTKLIASTLPFGHEQH